MLFLLSPDIKHLTLISSPLTRHRCSSSGDRGYALPAGWSRTPHQWHRRHSRAEAPHINSAQTPLLYCASLCHAEAPKWQEKSDRVSKESEKEEG